MTGEPKPKRKAKPKPTTLAARKALVGKFNNAGRAKDAEGFTVMERAFVMHYIGDCNWNGRAAAQAAGYSEKAADRAASRLIRLPKIATLIQAKLAERNKRLGITADTVLGESWRMYVMSASSGKVREGIAALDQIGRHVNVRAFRTQIGLGNPDGGPLEFDLSGLNADEKRTLLDLLARVDPEREEPADSSTPEGAGGGGREGSTG